MRRFFPLGIKKKHGKLPFVVAFSALLILDAKMGRRDPASKNTTVLLFLPRSLLYAIELHFFFWGVAAHGILSAFISFLEMSLLMGPQKRAFCILQHISILSRGASVCPAAEPLTKNVLQRTVRLQQFGGGEDLLLLLSSSLYLSPHLFHRRRFCAPGYLSPICVHRRSLLSAHRREIHHCLTMFLNVIFIFVQFFASFNALVIRW